MPKDEHSEEKINSIENVLNCTPGVANDLLNYIVDKKIPFTNVFDELMKLYAKVYNGKIEFTVDEIVEIMDKGRLDVDYLDFNPLRDFIINKVKEMYVEEKMHQNVVFNFVHSFPYNAIGDFIEIFTDYLLEKKIQFRGIIIIIEEE